MLCHLPSRQTVACGFSEAFSALTASPALVVSYLHHAQNLISWPSHPLYFWSALSLAKQERICAEPYAAAVA